MNGLSKDSATWVEVGEEAADQRVDNYLTRVLKGVPKSHIYRILRSGEVRVNSARVGPEHRLSIGDRVRLPPVRARPATTLQATRVGSVAPTLEGRVIHEDDALLVLDKPAGVAVHGGSGVSVGVIEQLRRERPHTSFLELVHRLDRDTSGVLLLAKKRSALTDLHAQLREGTARKHYLTLVKGRWRNTRQTVSAPLHKYVLRSGERRVRVDDAGQAARTIFRLERSFTAYSLLEAELRTGRTHQIRVHVAHLGYPIAGDDKYGDFELNRALARQGLKRMFLHACRMSVVHPLTRRNVTYEAPLAPELAAFLSTLESHHAAPI